MPTVTEKDSQDALEIAQALGLTFVKDVKDSFLSMSWEEGAPLRIEVAGNGLLGFYERWEIIFAPNNKEIQLTKNDNPLNVDDKLFEEIPALKTAFGQAVKNLFILDPDGTMTYIEQSWDKDKRRYTNAAPTKLAPHTQHYDQILDEIHNISNNLPTEIRKLGYGLNV